MRFLLLTVFTVVTLLSLFHASPGVAQAPAEPVRLFLDCPDFRCDFDHLRREIPFVSWVRNREDADVHVLVTTQRTGGGGREFTVAFLGRRRFQGRDDQLTHVSQQTDTDDEVRSALVRVLKLGLVPYVAKSGVAPRLDVTYREVPEAGADIEPIDPWNYWVFRARVNGFFNGEKTQDFINLFTSVSANRTTDAWKIGIGASASYSESNFEVSAAQTVTSLQRNYGLNVLVVRSLGDHWGAGIRAGLSHSTFVNQDLTVGAGPAIEYNVFPYSQSTRRQLTIRYGLGLVAFNYMEETIFDRTSEEQLDQSLGAALAVKQPWGSVGVAVQGSHFLSDFDKNRAVVSSDIDFRLFRGLSLNVAGSYSFVRDQLFLRKAGATPEEILLRRRQLATSFRYFASIGFTYQFGSKFANIVNPRFDTGGGRTIVIN